MWMSTAGGLPPYLPTAGAKILVPYSFPLHKTTTSSIRMIYTDDQHGGLIHLRWIHQLPNEKTDYS